MNKYLGVLIPGTSVVPYRTRFGAVAALALAPDADAQSPRLYSALVEGGGVLFDGGAAGQLQEAGFTVAVFTPTEAELSYLAAYDPRFREAPQLYLVTCPAPRSARSVGGARTCSQAPGLRRVEYSEARSLGLVKPSDLKPAEGFVGKVLGYLVFASDEEPTEAALASAQAAMRSRADLATVIERMGTLAQVSGRPLSPRAQAIWSHGAKVLAETAQPAEVFGKAYGVPKSALGALGAIPPAMLVGLAVVAVIVLSVSAAIWYLGEQQTRLADAAKAAHEAYMEQTAALRECAANTSLPRVERALCLQALKEIPKPPETPKGPADVLEALADAAPYITGLVFLGAGVVYLGPVLRQAGKTGAEGIRAVRQRIPGQRPGSQRSG